MHLPFEVLVAIGQVESLLLKRLQVVVYLEGMRLAFDAAQTDTPHVLAQFSDMGFTFQENLAFYAAEDVIEEKGGAIGRDALFYACGFLELPALPEIPPAGGIGLCAYVSEEGHGLEFHHVGLLRRDVHLVPFYEYGGKDREIFYYLRFVSVKSVYLPSVLTDYSSVMKYLVWLFLLLLSVAAPQLMARDGKIKVSKHIRYEGGVSEVKVGGERPPLGFGVLNIYHPTDQREPEISIRGLFKGWAADSASIVWSNGVIFNGSIKIKSFYEKSLKAEHIDIELLPGGELTIPKSNYPEKSRLVYHTTAPAKSRFVIIDKPQRFHAVLPDSVSVEVASFDYSLLGENVHADMQGIVVSENNGGYRLMGGPVQGDITLSIGTYTGSFAQNEHNWLEGLFISKEGVRYEGTFLEGMTFNQGKLTWPDGDWIQGRIVGSCKTIEKAMLQNGSCQRHFAEGYYEGTILEGAFDEGTLISPDGDRQQGKWVVKEGRSVIDEGTVHQTEMVDDTCSVEMNVTVKGETMSGETILKGRYLYPYKVVGTTIDDKLEGEATISYGPYTVNGTWTNGLCEEALITSPKEELECEAQIQRTEEEIYQISISQHGRKVAEFKQPEVSFPEFFDTLSLQLNTSSLKR